jgi:PPE-repeat protein
MPNPIPPFEVEFAAFWPELNTFRLQAGPGAAPMLQAAAGWEAFAIALLAQAAELASTLATLGSTWTGMGSEVGVAAAMPMVAWLETLATQAQARAARATAQAGAHTAAYAATPQLEELAQNHITHGVLEGTNFLGVNTVPIGLNEMDYMRMWALAASTMYAYLAETVANTVFEPIVPATPIVIPGVGEGVVSTSLAQAAAALPSSAAREAALAHVAGQATLESAGLQAGRGANLGNMAATNAEGQSGRANNATDEQLAEQPMQQVTQMGSQVGSQIMQAPQQAVQMLQSPAQQLSQPLQQATSMFTSMGGSMGADQNIQGGFLGTSPWSNHPVAGGSGAGSGAGLVRAAALPGMSGSSPRTPVLAKLVEKVDEVAVVEPAGAGAGASAKAGAAPVGSGSGAGPSGMPGHATKSGATKGGLKAPAPLRQDLSEEEGDDW